MPRTCGLRRAPRWSVVGIWLLLLLVVSATAATASHSDLKSESQAQEHSAPDVSQAEQAPSAFERALVNLTLAFSSGHASYADALDSYGSGQSDVIDGFFSSTSGHNNNWAVLVCTSRFWFNYRHIANTLSIYRTVKRLGIPDSNIILMLSDDVACNPRNRFPGTVYNNAGRMLDLYGSNIEVDYRGYEVTVENFIRLLTGRHDPFVPRSKRLLTNDRSNILVFMTGHGGDEFLKFQDSEEIGAYDIADAFAQMYEKQRYHEILFMVDTCQAATLYKRIYSPNILAAASSLKGESSYSHHLDSEIGVAVIDRFTYFNLETLERVNRGDPTSIRYLFDSYNPTYMLSTPGIRTDLFNRGLPQTLVTDFFGGVQNIELSSSRYTLLSSRAAADSASTEPLPKIEEPARARADSVEPIALSKERRVEPVPMHSRTATWLYLGALAAVVGAACTVFQNV
ncbi:peptidase C13 family-domain-containing protein [Polychytrium aggregatum]|uniref:peptidase C13 family-domain-containing protein n=1 Tax=Polychytrium aggregatum TaxID=110093 RepID=UPI0022FEE435|nr:peptidase C13 family-domain-containing protein [Polychytrium aggregatum]KAI9199253.1 peptidase C13 family-domain-containing protein [Polychytrium aggregatum]